MPEYKREEEDELSWSDDYGWIEKRSNPRYTPDPKDFPPSEQDLAQYRSRKAYDEGGLSEQDYRNSGG